MALDILNKKKVEANGLLSKIEIGGKVYEIKDLIARESLISTEAALSAAIAKVAEDLAKDIAERSYVLATGVFADDAAVKSYVDAQVGAINNFDVVIGTAGEDGKPNVAASEETMFKLYMIPAANAEAGTYVEYITVKNGDEYSWEAIGSTALNLDGYVTEEELAAELAKYQTVEAAAAEHKAITDDVDARFEALGDLAAKDEATGTVAGQTISGVKATGKTAGSISVTLEQSEHAMNSTGKYTPAGNVTGTVETAGSIAVTAKHDDAEAVLAKGDYTPAGTVSANFSHSATAATLTKGDYTPAGDVSVALSGATFNAITGVGTQASFTEGAFTPATLERSEVEANYVEKAIVGEVNDDECLVFTDVAAKALSATKVTAFDGGSKASDSFTANSLPTMAAQTVGVASASFTGTKATELVVTGVSYDKAALSDLSFSGTKAEGALVTGVTYKKADIDTATFTGTTVDIAASFAGTEGDLSVAGICHDYAVKTAEFTGADVELAVGDIVVSEKEVTVR